MNYRKSVHARVTLAFAIVIVVFGGAVALSIAKLAASNASLGDITSHQFAKVETATAWELAVSESMRRERIVLILDDKEEIQGEIATLRALMEKRKQLADKMTSLVQSAEGKALLRVALDANAAIVPLDAEFIRQIEAGDVKAAKELLMQRARPVQVARWIW